MLKIYEVPLNKYAWILLILYSKVPDKYVLMKSGLILKGKEHMQIYSTNIRERNT